ncbi:MAG: chromosomal replication initiator protein DnaA [Candidatus Eisenbacteria bacterium]|nr:chromosomal replication initiator protein DnaA [Candidatus Eisenbacteria bacterium]
MSPSEVWSRALKFLKESVNKQTFEAWFLPTRCVAFSAEGVRILVPNQFFADWLKDNHLPLIRESLARAIGASPPDVDFAVSDEPVRRPAPPPPQPQTQPPPQAPRPAPSQWSGCQLSERFSFDTFVVGRSNAFAHAAAQAVAENPGHAYNPLFVYGGVGLGKTHIIQAIGHRVMEKQNGSSVHYVSAESFMNEMIQSIQTGSTLRFKERYRNMDLLLLDDVQFLAGKESTQEEFFHTFNALFNARKQIVLTSDRPPKEITNLEERLVSRFEWGLVADIQSPDLETRIAILRKKAEMENLSIPDEVLLFIANSIRSNIREIEGSLVRLLAFSSLTGQDITIDMARDVLKDFLSRRGRNATVPLIQKAVAKEFHVPDDAMVSKRRTADIALARQVAMYLARELAGLSLKQIGTRFGGRDHTTVLHGFQKVEAMMKADDEFRARIDRLVDQVTS